MAPRRDHWATLVSPKRAQKCMLSQNEEYLEKDRHTHLLRKNSADHLEGRVKVVDIKRRLGFLSRDTCNN